MHIWMERARVGRPGRERAASAAPWPRVSPPGHPGVLLPSSLRAAFPSRREPRHPNLPLAAQNLSHPLSVVGIFSAPAAKVASQRRGADSQGPARHPRDLHRATGSLPEAVTSRDSVQSRFLWGESEALIPKSRATDRVPRVHFCLQLSDASFFLFFFFPG